MQLINKIKQKISLNQFLFICLFSLMITFNGFIFNQFDVMYKNQAEFGVSVSEIAWLFIVMAIAIWLVLVLFLTFVRYKSKKVFIRISAILLGIALASYIQVLFMNKPHRMNVAGTMSWREPPIEYISNALIFIAIIILPLFVLKWERKAGKSFTPKLAVLLSVVIFGMQLVGTISAANSAVNPIKGNELFYFSISQQFELSKNDNIIVFVMDRLDTENADAVFDTYQESAEIFKDFTYYKNNISEYPGTFPGVAALLTDADFGQDISKKMGNTLKSAWEDPVLIKTLQDNGYTINALLDSTSTFNDFNDLMGKIENIDQVKKTDRSVNAAKFYLSMQSFAMVRQSFDVSKILFRTSNYLDIPNYCINIKNTPDYFPRTISPNSDISFFNSLTKSENQLSSQQGNNVFSFVHLHSAHSPYLYDENLKSIDKFISISSKDMKRQTYGSFKILKEYFRQMGTDVYNNSTIIILGDHGNWDDANPTKNPPTTSLFIKRSGQTGTQLNIDYTSELSHDNFTASIVEIIADNAKKHDESKYESIMQKKGGKYSYFDIIDGNIKQPRLFYNIRWTNLNSCTYLSTYTVSGDASKSESWTKID